jgi:C-terminal processing protease CtpA/Prc
MSLYRDEPKKLLVANVLPGGPAAKAGLRKDDVVITIAGKQAELIGRREVSRILSQTPGTIIPVTYSKSLRPRSRYTSCSPNFHTLK